ncbi:hypothetical protein K438DRAFT_1791790 [Mycena galopus ATCC 62051]|nr:hypothetical protein K438DRAFT_1791790 [Mycena galopus ATCC 62051]
MSSFTTSSAVRLVTEVAYLGEQDAICPPLYARPATSYPFTRILPIRLKKLKNPSVRTHVFLLLDGIYHLTTSYALLHNGRLSLGWGLDLGLITANESSEPEGFDVAGVRTEVQEAWLGEHKRGQLRAQWLFYDNPLGLVRSRGGDLTVVVFRALSRTYTPSRLTSSFL